MRRTDALHSPRSLLGGPQNERHNSLFRAFVPKGASIEQHPGENILAGVLRAERASPCSVLKPHGHKPRLAAVPSHDFCC